MGIDPGERWIGWCKLRIRNHNQYEAQMGVYDRAPVAFTRCINRLVPTAETTVVCEQFRNRPLGYNRFSSLETPVLIGGLKYAMLSANQYWVEIAAGNPDKDLPRLPIHRYIKHWPQLPDENDPRWRHAAAAWSALGRWMMAMHLKHLENLSKPKKLPELIVLGNDEPKFGVDLETSTIGWEL